MWVMRLHGQEADCQRAGYYRHPFEWIGVGADGAIAKSRSGYFPLIRRRPIDRVYRGVCNR